MVQGLEVGSSSHHRVVGGDQSLQTCNNRNEVMGEVGTILVNTFSGIYPISLLSVTGLGS